MLLMRDLKNNKDRYGDKAGEMTVCVSIIEEDANWRKITSKSGIIGLPHGK